MKDKVCVHFILNGICYFKRYLYHPPLTGDEIRTSESTFYTVGKRVWVYDEEENPYSRLNVEITQIDIDEANDE